MYFGNNLYFAFFQEHPVFNPMGNRRKEEQDRKPCGDCIEQVGYAEGLLAMAAAISLRRSIAALPIRCLARHFALGLSVRFYRVDLSLASFPMFLMGGERRDDPSAKAGGDHPIAAKRENHDAQNHSDDLRNPDTKLNLNLYNHNKK